jgi:ABC-type glutathione transport system ATPase component
VLLADEVTSALDVSTQADILALLRGLQREFGLAMLFISHDLAVVESISSDVTVLLDGVVVEQGATASVLAAPEHAYTKMLISSVPTLNAEPACADDREKGEVTR